MGQGYVPPKGLRKHERLKKAGLVCKGGKLIPAADAFQKASAANKAAKTRAEEKLKNAVDLKKEQEKRRNVKLNKEILAFHSAVLLKPHSEFFAFVDENRTILCNIMGSGASLPVTDEKTVLSRDTFNRLNSLLKSYSLFFNGNDIVVWKER